MKRSVALWCLVLLPALVVAEAMRIIEARAPLTPGAVDGRTVPPIEAAAAGDDAALAAAQARIGAARLAAPAEAAMLLDQARERLRALPASPEHAFTLTALGLGYAALPGRRDEALEVLRVAADEAQALGDAPAEGYARGYLGRTLTEAGQRDAALVQSRRALLLSQTAPEARYRWQWQIGRLLNEAGELEGAIAAYRQAVDTLQQIRTGAGPDPAFRERLAPLYFELAELLLDRAPRLTDPQARQAALREARDTVEQFKAAELRDYFQDDCVTAFQARISPVERPDAAVLYPILLPGRTELLLAANGRLLQASVPIGRDALARETEALRQALERRTTHEYLPHAQRLYDWLIRPLEAGLAGQATLVIVPDGPLRTIPLAALHDGHDFVLRRFAVAITPGLSLTDARPLPSAAPRALLAGLSRAAQGFGALPGVARELAAVHALYGGTVLQDQAFSAHAVAQALGERPYTIVHIASHGRFERDPSASFLLAYDGRLTLDRLESLLRPAQYRDAPVELLTLSACETAAGDERAALGLAGVALKAGARSALASLWRLDDRVAAQLIADVYRGLKAGSSRAAALRAAQLRLLDDPRYRHPGYWAPLLLIGNWL